MTAAPVWLRPAYTAALALHVLIVAALVWLAFAVAGGLGQTANAARESAGLSVALFLTGLLPALPSIIALLSWWLCRRNGWAPSVAHMGLAVAAALVVAVVFLIVVLS
jgi:hypothetical protein